MPGGKTTELRPIGNVALKRESTLETDAGMFVDAPRRPLSDLDFRNLKRETVDLNDLGSQIINGLKSNGLDQYIEHFSTRIQRLKDILASDASHAQIPAEANQLLLEYRQILAGLDVNKPVKTRGIEINSQALSQLQSFVANTVNLLRALGKPDGKGFFFFVCTLATAELGFSS